MEIDKGKWSDKDNDQLEDCICFELNNVDNLIPIPKDIKIPDGSQNTSDINKKYNELTGESDTYNYDKSHTILEMQVDLDLEGFEDTNEQGEETGIAIPYVVTIDYPSGVILSIRRN